MSLAAKPYTIEEFVRAFLARRRGVVRAFAPLVLAIACGCRSEKAGSLRARLVLPPHDTVQFTAGARMWRCGGERGLVLKGVDGGNGLLLWLRPGDSTLHGEYRVIGRGDTIAPRGAVGAVRFLVQTTDRGVTLDSGVVTVSSTGGRFEAHARGSGFDPRAGQRVVIDASFGAVPIAADTVDCRVQL